MKTKNIIYVATISILVVLFGASVAWPTGLLAATGEGHFAGKPEIDSKMSIPGEDLLSERLLLISEMTGFKAVISPISEDCTFSLVFDVFLCQESARTTTLKSDPAARAKALHLISSTGILIIPDSTNKRLMTFDPISGDLVDPNFIILEEEATGTIIHAILGADQNSLLISDQTRNVVHHYDLAGNYLGDFAPAGGADTEIMQNIRGISLRPNGNLLVSVGGGPNANAIAEFDTEGEYLGNFVDNGSGGLISPFDVFGRPDTDWLVSSINSNEVLQYAYDNGEPIGQFASISSFPQQILEIGSSNVLVGNFSGTQGVYEFDTDGELIDVYNPSETSNYRGVYELLNGNILTTTTGGVFEINRDGELVDTKYSGQSRFIEYVQLDLPLIELAKTVGLEPDVCAETDEIVVPAGSAVTYCFEVTNTGSITLELHDLVDDQLGVILDGLALSLEPGVSVYLTQSVLVDDDTVNTATWTAYNPGPSDVAMASDSATVYMLFRDLELNPEELFSSGDPGETVQYILTLTNTGNAIDLFTVEAGESEWEVDFPETGFELEPGGSVEVVVLVDIPEDALAGDQDSVMITATSMGDESVTGSSMLTTTANAIYDLMLAPEEQASFGDPGEMVEFALTLTNTGNGPDTIQVEATESEWEVSLPVQIFHLDLGESAEVVVLVAIPEETLANELDMVVITAISEGDEGVTASSTLTTTANVVFGLWLEPEEAVLSGDPEETVEYSLLLTNAGNAQDTFILEASESDWEVMLPEINFELAAWESVEVVIQVSIPEEALAGEQDVVVIMATSSGDDSLSVSSTLTTTTNPVYGIMLEPGEDSKKGAPGETITYTLIMTNLGNDTDTFVMEAGESEWEVHLPTSSFEVEVGESVEVTVQIMIPADVNDGDSDAVTINATSVGDPSKSGAAELNTIAEIEGYWLYLPSLFRGSSP